MRARLGAPQRHAYGLTEIEALDIYSTEQPDAPIHIYIHGGAWVSGAAKHCAFPAEMFVRAGAHYVVPDFVTVGDTSADLFPLAEQVCRAIAWVHKNARTFGGDPNHIYLSGHSSGAQLAAVALTTDWFKVFGLPRGFIKGALLCSGIYDLKPLRLSARSRDVAFTDEVEQALSPQRHAAHIDCPVILAHSKLDNSEFQRQSREFAAALEAAGKSVKLLIIEGYNHVELIETLSNPYSSLSRAALEQMTLIPG